MASITTKSAAQFVQSWAAAAQAAAAQVLDFSVGSVNRAIAEGGTTIGLWLQRVALRVAALSRFATSFASDADSWGAQFGYTRLAAKAATGAVTFSRANTSAAGAVAIGNRLQSTDGTQNFTITADAANPAYSASLVYGPSGGYVAAIGVATLSVPVQAAIAGTGGNILASQLTSMLDAEPGWDSVTNPAAFSNGVNAESDPDYKSRFPNWLAGLASADNAAIIAAIQGVQQGLKYLLIENFDYPGTIADNGSFFVVIDDGSHVPPASLLTLVYNAVYAVRGFGVRFQGAYAPTPLTVNLAGTIATAAGYTHGTVVQAVDAAWAAWLNGLALGAGVVPVAEVAAIAMGVAGVTNITLSTILINGVNADLTLTQVQVPVPGTIAAA